MSPRVSLEVMSPSLSLRNLKIAHAPDAHHVMFNGLTIGSISSSMRAYNEVVWKWWIYETGHSGEGLNLDHCMAHFKAAWVKFAQNPDRLFDFMAERRYQESGRVWN